MLCALIMVPLALIGPFFGSFDLAKSVHPTSRVHPFVVLLQWLGVLAVNFFVTVVIVVATL
jgi:hypothetical protein